MLDKFRIFIAQKCARPLIKITIKENQSKKPLMNHSILSSIIDSARLPLTMPLLPENKEGLIFISNVIRLYEASKNASLGNKLNKVPIKNNYIKHSVHF